MAIITKYRCLSLVGYLTFIRTDSLTTLHAKQTHNGGRGWPIIHGGDSSSACSNQSGRRQSRSQVLATLQKCHKPSDLLSLVNSVDNALDADGIVSSLILVRLAKQLLFQFDGTPKDEQFQEKIEMEGSQTIADCEVFHFHGCVEKLCRILTASTIETQAHLDAAIEGTKSTSTICRLLWQSTEKTPSISNNTGKLLLKFWSRFDEIHRLEEHHLSGLHWAFEVFRLHDPDIHLPTAIQKAYNALNLPFTVQPGCLSSMKELSVSGLLKQVQFRAETIRTTTNKVVVERRQTAWEGDPHVGPFLYSGKSMVRNDWSNIVLHVRDAIEKKTHQHYDCCLLNLYPDGGSGMRYHIDPDQGTLWDYDTSVVSVGSFRCFSFRRLNGSGAPHNFVVMHGDCTYMFADCQQRYQHTVKKQKGITTPRASLVFKRTYGVDKSSST